MAMTDLTNIRVKVEVHRSEDGIPDPKDDLENCFSTGDTAITPKSTCKVEKAQQTIAPPREKMSAINVHNFYKQAGNQLQALETKSVESDLISNTDESMPSLELSTSIDSDQYSFTDYVDDTCPDLGKSCATTCIEKVDSWWNGTQQRTHELSTPKHGEESRTATKYPCNLCDKSFTQASSRKTHLRIHTGEKPYQCAVCQKRFAWKASMNVHERVHTGEKPFQCHICQKHFCQTSSRNLHVKTQH